MRSNSLSGTRPARTSASVPRLSAPCRARTRTSPGRSGASFSSRISARPGPTYQSASARVRSGTSLIPVVPCNRSTAISGAAQKSRNDRGDARPFCHSRSCGRRTRRRHLPAAGRCLPLWLPPPWPRVLWLASVAVPPRSFGAIAFLVLFAVTLPWSVIGFWNAVIGFLIMRFCRDPAAAVNPLAARIRGDEPVTSSTAILMCIRNESPEQVVRNLQPMLEGLVQAQVAHLFHVYLLSDSSDPGIIAAETSRFEPFIAKWRDTIPVTYRRRAVNTAFKAGNIRDFCDRWGNNHEFAVTLDADSFMPAQAVLRLVRIMQANPTLGILQTLIVGMPSISRVRARLFQFGMRLGMRSYTLGATWWQGDCGPYWGHNAILRLAPFIAHCRLPVLPGDGPLAGPSSQPRPGRGGADAPRRLRSQGAAARRIELGGKSADADGIHPPRSALVPGQHAVLAVARPCPA